MGPICPKTGIDGYKRKLASGQSLRLDRQPHPRLFHRVLRAAPGPSLVRVFVARPAGERGQGAAAAEITGPEYGRDVAALADHESHSLTQLVCPSPASPQPAPPGG